MQHKHKSMHPEIVAEINTKIYRKFPEMRGIRPKVRKQPVPKGQARPKKPVYLLTYSKKARGPGNVTIPRWVRVSATPEGKIIKTTTSR